MFFEPVPKKETVECCEGQGTDSDEKTAEHGNENF